MVARGRSKNAPTSFGADIGAQNRGLAQTKPPCGGRWTTKWWKEWRDKGAAIVILCVPN